MTNEPSLAQGSENTPDPWEWWDAFRSAANYEKKIALALEVGKGRELRLPPFPFGIVYILYSFFSDTLSEANMRRWLGEPIKALILNTGLYLTNKKGYPVLPKAIQVLVKRFIPLNVQVTK